MAKFKQECDKQLKNFGRLNGEPEVEVLNEYKERVQLGLSMIKYCCEVISPEFDRGFTPVEVEVAFEIPVLSPQGDAIWCKCEQCWKRYTNQFNDVKTTKRVDRSVWKGLPV